MGYDIKIGEASISPSPDELPGFELNFGPGYQPEVVVHQLEREDAPEFPGDPTGRTNHRSPSYSAWHDFARTTGLEEMFYKDGCGLMRETRMGAYGISVIRPSDRHLVGAMLSRYRQRHPGVTPQQISGDLIPANLCRLIWLDWWMEWALENCRVPCLHYS